MNTQHLKIRIAGLLLALSPLMAAGATPTEKSAEGASAPVSQSAQEAKRPCQQCGIIEAISPRIISAGVNGYYTYDLFVRMEKTGLLRIVPTPTVGPMEVGDRVQVMGGVAQPFL